MKVQFHPTSQQMRVTPIENLFLDTYLSSVSGETLKVYLYAWMLCYQEGVQNIGVQTGEGRISRQTLELRWAKNLNMDAEKVAQALDFWEKEGLLDIHESDDEGMSFFLRSMLSLWSEVGGTEKSVAKHTESQSREMDASASLKREPKLSDSDGADSFSAQKYNSLQRRDAMDAIESTLQHPGEEYMKLKDGEIRQILDFMDEYPQVSPAFVAYAYKRALAQPMIKSRTVPYILGVVDSWIRVEGIRTQQELDSHLERSQKPVKKAARSRPKGQYVKNDTRMTKQERQEWVAQRLQQSLTATDWGPEDEETSDL